jgi:hypothetical protein
MVCAHCAPVGNVEYDATGRVEKYPSVRGGAPFCAGAELLVVGGGVELGVDVVPAATVVCGADVAVADEAGLDVRGVRVGPAWPPAP